MVLVSDLGTRVEVAGSVDHDNLTAAPRHSPGGVTVVLTSSVR